METLHAFVTYAISVRNSLIYSEHKGLKNQSIFLRHIGHLKLDFHIHARGKIQLHESINGLRSQIFHIHQPLVGPQLKLLTRILVYVGRAEDGVHAFSAPNHEQFGNVSKIMLLCLIQAE